MPDQKFGERWRLLAHESGGSYAVEDRGTFDELVVDDWLHVEQLDDALWWIRLGDARIHVRLGPGCAPIVDVERGVYAAVAGTTAAAARDDKGGGDRR